MPKSTDIDKKSSKKLSKSKKYIEDSGSDEEGEKKLKSIKKINIKKLNDNENEDGNSSDELDDKVDLMNNDVDDDSEEEDDDEEAAQEEFNGFIVDNEEEEEEDDENNDNKKKHKNSRKKKKNSKESSSGSSGSSSSSNEDELQSDLEEDDLDLIKDNLNLDDLEQVGIKKDKKRRRIQVHSESSENEEESEIVSKEKKKKSSTNQDASSLRKDEKEEDEEELENLAEQRDSDKNNEDVESDEESFIVDDSEDENRQKNRRAHGEENYKSMRKKRVYNDEAQQEALDIFGVDAEELGVMDEDGSEAAGDDELDEEEDDEAAEDDYYSEGDEGDELDEVNRRFERKQQNRKKSRKQMAKIEDIFEPQELEKNLMTEYDNTIRIEDKPERFMLRTLPVSSEPNENELEKEAEWIYNQAFLANTFISNKELFTHKDARCIPRIKDVLNFIRNEFFEVPFIATYRKEFIHPELKLDDLWLIYKMDEKYCQLKTRKENLCKLFERMKNYQQVQISELENKRQELDQQLCRIDSKNEQEQDQDEIIMIKEQINAINNLLSTIRRLKQSDLDRVRNIQTQEEYLDCYQHFQLYYAPDLMPMKDYEFKMRCAKKQNNNRNNKEHCEIEEYEEQEDNKELNEQEDKEEEFINTTKYAQRKDKYHYCKLAGLNSLANRFGLSADQFAENLHADFQKHEIEQHELDPKYLANEYIRPPYFETCEQVLANVRYMISVEFAREPSIRSYVRDFYYANACINVCATMPRGFNEIDESHACYKFKYLKMKPCKELQADEFLKLALAEQDGLLTIKFDLASSSSIDSNEEQELDQTQRQQRSSLTTTANHINIDYDWDDDNINSNNDKQKLDRAYESKNKATASATKYNSLFDKLKSFYYKDEFSYNVEQWNIQRGLIIEEMLKKILYPEFEKELRAKLTNEAKQHVYNECGKKLRTFLRQAPYSNTAMLSGNALDDDEDGLRVLSISYQSGSSSSTSSDEKLDQSSQQNYTICACVNSDGELDDFLCLNNLLVRTSRHHHQQQQQVQLNDEQRNKINDLKRLEDYILNKRPKCIIINAENKDAMNLYDDISDLLKKIQLEQNNLAAASINIELVDNEIAKLIDSSKYCQHQFFNLTSSNNTSSSSMISNSLLRQALTLARYIQDPLLCYSQLCNIDRDILGLKLHPMQHLLIAQSGGRNSSDSNDLLFYLEREFIQVTNECGIDLNRCNQSPHTSNCLQFVSGLGPRKAQYILKLLRQERLALKSTLPFDKQLKTYPVILNRLSLVTKCQLGRRVFINCAGFIKFDVDFISREIEEENDDDEEDHNARLNNDDGMYTEPLDSTRIHPETYEWARKMAIDALDFEDEDDDDDDDEKNANKRARANANATNPNAALKEILENPKRLKDLDLDAFADELERTGHGDKHITLYDIRQELNYRFRDKRQAFQSMPIEAKFYALLNETPQTFHVGKLILCKVVGIVRRKPNKEQLDEANPLKDDNTCTWQCSFCKRNDFTELSKVWQHFDNGECPGPAIGVRTLLDNGCNGFVSVKNFSDNPVQNLEDRIKLGMVIHARVREIQYDRLRCDLTTKTSDLKDVNEKFRPVKDRCYDYQQEQNQIDRCIEKKKKEEHKQTYTKRVIAHPQFKNCGYMQAISLLKEQGIGDCIIRPSSKGNDHLTATWKVNDDCFQHVDILEEKKSNLFSIGKKLIIDGEDFEDLDEILARYINPMANFIKEIVAHKNFKQLKEIDANLNEKTQFTKQNKLSEMTLTACEKLMQQERIKNPNRIPYMFICCLNFPGRFCLLYMLKSKSRYEFIKVTPDGFVFREKKFNNFAQLLSWFKQNFNEYVQPPPPSITSSIQQKSIEKEEKQQQKLSSASFSTDNNTKMDAYNSSNSSYNQITLMDATSSSSSKDYAHRSATSIFDQNNQFRKQNSGNLQDKMIGQNSQNFGNSRRNNNINSFSTDYKNMNSSFQRNNQNYTNTNMNNSNNNSRQFNHSKGNTFNNSFNNNYYNNNRRQFNNFNNNQQQQRRPFDTPQHQNQYNNQQQLNRSNNNDDNWDDDVPAAASSNDFAQSKTNTRLTNMSQEEEIWDDDPNHNNQNRNNQLNVSTSNTNIINDDEMWD